MTTKEKIAKYSILTPIIKAMVEGIEFEANEPTIRNLIIGKVKSEITEFFIKDDFVNWIEVTDDGRIGNGDYSIEGLEICARLIGQLWQLQHNL